MQSDINYVNVYYPLTVYIQICEKGPWLASLKNMKNVKIIEIQ